jgi:hypothetical protein
MSEFELASLYNDVHATLLTQLSLEISFISGFFVLSYFVAHRLTALMVVLLIGTYSYFTLAFTSLSFRLEATYGGLMDEMQKFRDAGKGLDWHYATQTPASVAHLIPWLGTSASVVIYLGSLLFFFHCRRMNARATTSMHTPLH